MEPLFITIAFAIGFAGRMVGIATASALATYVTAWILSVDDRKHLARRAAWAVWFSVIAYNLSQVAFVKAYFLSGAYWQAAIFGGGVVLAMVGLGLLMIRSSRRSLRAASLVTAFLIIALVGVIPLNGGQQGGSLAAPADEASAKIAASLYAAAQRGDVAQVKTLVDQGAGVDGPFLGLAPLYGAVIERQLEATNALLDLGADVNSANGPAQRRPLHQAVRNGDIPMIELLLRSGASVTATTTFGRTALDYAIGPPPPLAKPENSDEIAAMLRAAGAK